MSEYVGDYTIEVPVTRIARAMPLGHLRRSGYLDSVDYFGPGMEPGRTFAVKSTQGAPWRPGIGHVLPDRRIDVSAIPAACDGDLVCGIEPEAP